jgi:hypothetical protein
MAWDLRRRGVPSLDLLEEDLSLLDTQDVADLALTQPSTVPHVFSSISAAEIDEPSPPFMRVLRELAYRKLPVVIWVRLDQYAQSLFEKNLSAALKSMGYGVETQWLRSYIDKREVSVLIDLLDNHGRLAALADRTRAAQFAAFARRATRSLAAVLREATLVPDGGNFSDIVWSEYRNLSPKVQHLYTLVTMCSSRGVGLPRSLFERVSELSGRGRAFVTSQAFLDETAGLLRITRAGTFFARNDDMAELLAGRLTSPQYEAVKQGLVSATLRALDLADPEHERFLQVVIASQLLRLLRDLSPIAKRIAGGEFVSLQGHSASQLLNSIIRILQSRGEYDAGLALARRSIELWQHVGNQAYFLKGFCEYYLGKRKEAAFTAERLVRAEDYPHHALHGAILFKLLRKWPECKSALNRFANAYKHRLDEFPEYSRLNREVDLWLRVSVSSPEAVSQKPTLRLERLETTLLDEGRDEAIFEEYRQILRLQHDFVRAYASLFRWLNSPIPNTDEQVRLRRYRWLELECQFHLEKARSRGKKYPNEILSLLNANFGRALFRQEYIRTAGATLDETCEVYFGSAIEINPKNTYAHNWFGTYLKQTKRLRDKAKIEYESAIRGDAGNPVFRHNLALLLFEAPKFTRRDLESALRLALHSRDICESEAQWQGFRPYPVNLSLAITHLLENSSNVEGEPVYRSDMISSDM